MDNEHWGRNEDLHPLQVNLWRAALLTVYLVFKLLCLVELGQAVVKRCVVLQACSHFVRFFPGRGVLDHFVGHSIVVFSELLRVPLDRQKALFDEIFFENGRVGGQDYAPVALLHPMAEGASVA